MNHISIIYRGTKWKRLRSLLMLLACSGSNAQTLQSYTAVKDTTPKSTKGSVWFVSEDRALSGSLETAPSCKADTSDLSTWSLLIVESLVSRNQLARVREYSIILPRCNGAIYKTTDVEIMERRLLQCGSYEFIDRITFFMRPWICVGMVSLRPVYRRVGNY